MKDNNKALFIDIRSTQEVILLGTPKLIDKNVPFMNISLEKWNESKKDIMFTPNQTFVQQIHETLFDKGLDENAPIFLMCRSGDRSASATTILKKAGFKNVFSIIDGYEGDKIKEGENKGKRMINGWKNESLEWEYLSNPQKLTGVQ